MLLLSFAVVLLAAVLLSSWLTARSCRPPRCS